MLKLLIFSDSHGITRLMEQIIENNRGLYNYIIHLGDLLRDVRYLEDKYKNERFIYVPGNNDYSFDIPSEIIIKLGKAKLFIAHGHTSGISGLRELAVREGVNAVFTGHTHKAGSIYYKNILFLNPGSISRPRDGTSGSYAVINIENGIITEDIKRI